MKTMMSLKILLVLLFAYGNISADTFATEDYLVPPGYADAYISMPEGDPIGMPDPKLTIILVEGDDLEVDSVHLRIFNGEHQLLGEYCSFEHKTVVDPRMVIIYDTAAVNYYGMYYIEASKPGYKTREIAYELGRNGVYFHRDRLGRNDCRRKEHAYQHSCPLCIQRIHEIINQIPAGKRRYFLEYLFINRYSELGFLKLSCTVNPIKHHD